MPFYRGERVNLRFVGKPDVALLQIAGRHLTVANGGLAAQRDGGLIAVVQLPDRDTEVTYAFADGEVTETGKLRVVGARTFTEVDADMAAAVIPGVVELG